MRCPRFATIDLHSARADPRKERIGWCNAAMNLTTRQFLRDFAFTCGAAIATGGVVSAVAVTVILIFASA